MPSPNYIDRKRSGHLVACGLCLRIQNNEGCFFWGGGVCFFVLGFFEVLIHF